MPRNARSSLTGFQGGPPTHHMGIIHDFKLPGDPEICAMSVAVRADREGDRASIVPTGPFDLAHATAAARAVESAEARLSGCRSVDVHLAQLEHIDGAGAVLLARLLDRLDAGGCRACVVEGHNRKAARLIALYRERRGDRPAPQTPATSPLARIGALAAQLPSKAYEALDFIGRDAAALPKAAAKPYLDTALRLEVASRRDVRLVDADRAPWLAQRSSCGISSLKGGRDSWGLWSFRSRGPTACYIHKWCEPVRLSQRSYLATWQPSRVASCAASRPRASHSSQASNIR